MFDKFLCDFECEINWVDGAVSRRTVDIRPISSSMMLSSMRKTAGVVGVPDSLPAETVADRLCEWIMRSTKEQRRLAGLSIDPPPPGIHFVPGKFPVFYDFHNLDIALGELTQAGATISGSLLDFGCSSGRNLAALQAAYGGGIELFGVDPSRPSIEWLSAHVPNVVAHVSRQDPPLDFASDTFDLVIAKSIWTHFSPNAAKAWFREIARILAPGGHFFFSAHGPHDIASRIVYDNPKPRYERFSGTPDWTRDSFLSATIQGLRREGHFFRPYKETGHQGDLRGVDGASTSDWGLMFMTPDYVRRIIPDSLKVVRRSIARTAGRHDAYVVRKI